MCWRQIGYLWSNIWKELYAIHSIQIRKHHLNQKCIVGWFAFFSLTVPEDDKVFALVELYAFTDAKGCYAYYPLQPAFCVPGAMSASGSRVMFYILVKENWNNKKIIHFFISVMQLIILSSAKTVIFYFKLAANFCYLLLSLRMSD